MLTVDEHIRKLIIERATATAIRQHAQKTQGMLTMLQDGREKVLAGHTTIAEVLRVCQREDFDS
jgi:type II secretory ATPase GspE/PulE/Tfp pilus assembly ATPase PilB-like protein